MQDDRLKAVEKQNVIMSVKAVSNPSKKGNIYIYISSLSDCVGVVMEESYILRKQGDRPNKTEEL